MNERNIKKLFNLEGRSFPFTFIFGIFLSSYVNRASEEILLLSNRASLEILLLSNRESEESKRINLWKNIIFGIYILLKECLTLSFKKDGKLLTPFSSKFAFTLREIIVVIHDYNIFKMGMLVSSILRVNNDFIHLLKVLIILICVILEIVLRLSSNKNQKLKIFFPCAIILMNYVSFNLQFFVFNLLISSFVLIHCWKIKIFLNTFEIIHSLHYIFLYFLL